jgi:hypothetical protein
MSVEVMSLSYIAKFWNVMQFFTSVTDEPATFIVRVESETNQIV